MLSLKIVSSAAASSLTHLPIIPHTQELKEALDALGFGGGGAGQSLSHTSTSDQQAAAGASGVEGFASATFPELALLCR